MMKLAADPNVASYFVLKPKRSATVAKTHKPVELSKFKTLKDFTHQLESFIHKTTTIKITPEGFQQKKRKVDVTTHRPTAGYVPQETIFAGLEKCISNEEFWSKEGLDALLSNNCITPGINDDAVFKCIWKYNAYSSFKAMVVSYQIVPDKYILQSLKCLLNNVPAGEVTALMSNLQTDVFSVPPGFVLDLSYIVLLPFNTSSLKDYMKLLTVDEALKLMQCFYFLLHLVSPALVTKCTDTNLIDEGVTERKVVLWLDLVLTAHIVVFTTSPSLSPIISDIKKSLQRQQVFYQNVGKMTPYLEYIKESKTLPEKIIGEYSIETITL